MLLMLLLLLVQLLMILHLLLLLLVVEVNLLLLVVMHRLLLLVILYLVLLLLLELLLVGDVVVVLWDDLWPRGVWNHARLVVAVSHLSLLLRLYFLLQRRYGCVDLFSAGRNWSRARRRERDIQARLDL